MTSKESLNLFKSGITLPASDPANVNWSIGSYIFSKRHIVWISAVLSALAGIGHLSLVPEHGEALAAAFFFILVGAVQLGLGGLILIHRSSKIQYIGIGTSTALIALYIATRFVAVPFGHPHLEPVEVFGVLVKLMEGGFIASLLYLSVGTAVDSAKVNGRILATGSGTGGKEDRSHMAYLLVATLVGGVVLGIFVSQAGVTEIFPKPPIVVAQNIREVTLIVEPRQMTVGDKSWEVWTYNGTVPAPTIKGTVGEVLRIKLVNKHNLTHSIHTHLRSYKFEMDGSQANVITGKGAGSMVPPNGEYVYEFPLTTPGIYYFHCHSSDGGRPISMHIRMGLYGALVVDEPDRPPAKEFVLFYSEGQPGSPAPFVINNRGIPGGEHTLEQIFKQKGFAGVAEQLNVTATAIKVSKGDVVRLHVINIGDLYHSHHHHGFEHRSIRTLRGDSWAASVLPLVPGQADSLEFRATEPGLWLIHCHVVSHADAGMIAALIVE